MYVYKRDYIVMLSGKVAGHQIRCQIPELPVSGWWIQEFPGLFILPPLPAKFVLLHPALEVCMI